AVWTGWSVCSRSCGGGASIRTRTCNVKSPQKMKTQCLCVCVCVCVCVQECPFGSEDFREMQCAAFNDRPLVSGSSFKWTPFHGDPCELSCLALGHNFYYNFGHVLDGTACDKEHGAVCVKGRCLKPGCDFILGSKQQEDACMVCGGQNNTCLRHKSVYQSNGLEAGRIRTHTLMHTHILSPQESQDQHALGIFVINGNWKISVPGEYNVAGTKLLYRRSADTWESFEVPGPTKEDLHLLVLATDRNPGIEYEYWLPPDQYDLYHGRRSPLRQAHHTASYLPWDQPTAATTTTTWPPPVTTRPHWWDCGHCRRVKGRRERQRQYCQKDFVFRARVLRKLYTGEETRYDIQIIHTYRNRFRLEHREFLWVPNVCDCPHLEEGRQYVLMVRRHINYERTLNRILLEEESYVVPYKPREDELLRPLERLCSNRGPARPSELRGQL
uniref:NTR domain-containing protein n=1 Tax=Monopterus albus TaxID=43700 RepID=A0A3Q3JJ49_MONAL